MNLDPQVPPLYSIFESPTIHYPYLINLFFLALAWHWRTYDQRCSPTNICSKPLWPLRVTNHFYLSTGSCVLSTPVYQAKLLILQRTSPSPSIGRIRYPAHQQLKPEYQISRRPSTTTSIPQYSSHMEWG